MGIVLLILCAVVGLAVVAIVALAAVFGWGGSMALAQRLGLCGLAAGLVGAGVDRALQKPVGVFDLLFLAGLGLYLTWTYGPAILRRADALDGRMDGRLDAGALLRGSDPKAARSRQR